MKCSKIAPHRRKSRNEQRAHFQESIASGSGIYIGLARRDVCRIWSLVANASSESPESNESNESSADCDGNIGRSFCDEYGAGTSSSGNCGSSADCCNASSAHFDDDGCGSFIDGIAA
jgi:hypothetical protein